MIVDTATVVFVYNVVCCGCFDVLAILKCLHYFHLYYHAVLKKYYLLFKCRNVNSTYAFTSVIYVQSTNVITTCFFLIHLRNEFKFWSVHGIMNTSGLLQSK